MNRGKTAIALVFSGLVVITVVWAIRITRLFGGTANSYGWQVAFLAAVLVFALVAAVNWWFNRSSQDER
jgi:4-amino-4-deoxy-L-arabinose transferase-like glycosyltransferase